jgi:hypothetical protein
MGCGLVTPGKTSADGHVGDDGASAAACGNGSTSAVGCDCGVCAGGKNCEAEESEADDREGGNGEDIRYSATKMIATSAGQTGRLKTAGFASPETRGSEERRACRLSVAAKRARQDNMSEAEKGVGQQRAEAR